MSTAPVSAHIEVGWADLYAGLEDLRGVGRSARCVPYVFLIWLLRNLPRGAARGIGKGLGLAAYLCLRGHRERAVDNVLAFFPGSDRAWAAGVTLRSMEGLGSALAEAAGLAKQGREKLLAGTAAIGAENLEEALGVGSGVVVASAHMGCWELLPAYLAARGRRVAVLARPQAGRRESKLLREERGRLGVEEIGLGVAPLKRAVRILKAGGIVVCPFDRGRAMREDREGARQGLSAPALGVKLSATTGSVILPARALVSAGRHALVFEKPMMVGPRSDLEAAVRELESAVAKWVRQTPDQWVWLDGGRTQSAEV